jgi:hypothetical protein
MRVVYDSTSEAPSCSTEMSYHAHLQLPLQQGFRVPLDPGHLAPTPGRLVGHG